MFTAQTFYVDKRNDDDPLDGGGKTIFIPLAIALAQQRFQVPSSSSDQKIRKRKAGPSEVSDVQSVKNILGSAAGFVIVKNVPGNLV